MIIEIDINISGVMSDVFRNTIPSSKPSAIPSAVPFEISGIIPGTIPGAMLDVFLPKIHGAIPIANPRLIYGAMISRTFFGGYSSCYMG